MSEKISNFKQFKKHFLNENAGDTNLSASDIENIVDAAIEVRKSIEDVINSYEVEIIQEELIEDISSLILSQTKAAKSDYKLGEEIDFEPKRIAKEIYNITKDFDSENSLKMDFDMEIKSKFFNFQKIINYLLSNIEDENLEKKVAEKIFRSIIKAQKDMIKGQTKSLYEFQYDIGENLEYLRVEKGKGNI